MKHTEYYIRKKELTLQYKNKIQELKRELDERLLQERLDLEKVKLDTKLEKERNRLETKMKEKVEKQVETRARALERKRNRYADTKENDELYQKYLEYQRRYREKYRLQRKEKYHQQLLKKLEGTDYRVFEDDVTGKKLYVTRSGRFYKETGLELTGHKHPSGYIALSFAGKYYMAHRLVWQAFNGAIPEDKELDHISTIRTDNSLDNLRLQTHRENCRNPISVKNYSEHNKKVDRSYLRKRVYQYTMDGELIGEYESVKECESQGFSPHCIRICCTGRIPSYRGYIWTYQKK